MAFAAGEALRKIREKQHGPVWHDGDHVVERLRYFLKCLTTRHDWSPRLTVQARDSARMIAPGQDDELYPEMRAFADSYTAVSLPSSFQKFLGDSLDSSSRWQRWTRGTIEEQEILCTTLAQKQMAHTIRADSALWF